MTSITPTQSIVYSAATQKTALSGVSNNVSSTSVSDATGASDVALTSNVSDQLIGTSGLYNASLDLAGLSSQLQVAQTGTQQISSILQNLQSIAQQISEGTGNTGALETQFQSLYSQIEQVIADTTFGGSSLLNGSFSLDNSTLGFAQAGDQTTSPSAIPNLSTQALFGGNPPDVTTPQNASDAVSSIANAENIVNAASSNIEDVSNQVNFVMASIETAQSNNYAAASTLSESELGNSGFISFASELSGNPTSSANAQTGKMSGSTLKLLGE